MTRRIDVLVIGGGAFGLSAARSCAEAGLKVVLAEANQIGTGASGGLVGALAPHRPDPWHAFNHFQLVALEALPDYMAKLHAQTGSDPGYARTGRLSPLIDADQRKRARVQSVAAETHWAGIAQFEVLETPPPQFAGWLSPRACPHGVVRDTLSARVAPRAYMAALSAVLAGRVDLRAGWRCNGLDPATGTAWFDQGNVAANHIVVAAGAGAPALLDGLTGQSSGTGVKGQAALLVAETPPGLPIIQGDGVYIVAHGPGQVAVGSTSETAWDHPHCDHHLDAQIARARALCPALERAEVTERWAGIRPRAPGNAPMVGPLPGMPRVIVATGGYKIGLGEVTARFEAAGVQHVVFGHLHALDPARKGEIGGEARGVTYTCASCDFVDFAPVEICEV